MTICAPPNGIFLFPLAARIALSMASIKSDDTIEISSITSMSSALRTSLVLLDM